MSSFSGTEPKARPATVAKRTAMAAELDNFLPTVFPPAPVGSTVSCPFFGSDQSQQDAADIRIKAVTKKQKIAASETLGEEGALQYLKERLAHNNIPYDATCLHTFTGANTFNMVYVHPDTTNPTSVVILEAKGGDSNLGSRKDPLTGATVKQGTSDYAEVETYVMSISKDQDKKDVATAIYQCMGKTPPSAFYIGVKTKFNVSQKEIYEPVPIFAQPI